MRSEIIQSVAYDSYDDFQHINFIVSHNCVSLFWGLFEDEIGLRVKYAIDSKAKYHAKYRVNMWCLLENLSYFLFIIDISE
jgi:hypothetical protein